ncbi:MAG: S41 family peptidase [Pseudomonadota bacterium]
MGFPSQFGYSASTNSSSRRGLRSAGAYVEPSAAFKFLLAILLPICIFSASIVPDPCFAAAPGSAPPHRFSDAAIPGGSKEAPPLFRETVMLIRANYANEVSEEDIFGSAAEKLCFVLMPYCLEGTKRVGDCKDPPDQCFLETMDQTAAVCGIAPEKLMFRGLNLALRELDPYCALLDDQMLKELHVTASGTFGGIGMMVAPRDGDYVVISSFEGSPARKAGLKSGAKVQQIDDTPIHGLPLLEVLAKVRGPAGSKIRLLVKDPETGSTHSLELRRQVIHIPPVRSATLDPGIGYMRIVNFQDTTAREMAAVLKKLPVKGRGKTKGLILDLRDNPGGLFDQAIKAANLFLSTETITLLKGRNERMNQVFRADNRRPFNSIPLAVLVNRGSASAAEILAGAVQGKPNVVVMGERSFGKASVQSVYPLSNGMALRLTTAHYYTPDGRDIDGKGIQPDIWVTDETTDHPGDGGPPDADKIAKDPLVRKAVEMLLVAPRWKRAPFTTTY